MVCARIEPSAWRVPVIVTVWLSCRSAVDPSTCLERVTVGPNVTFTSQLVLVTVIEVPPRLVTVPRASPCVPAAVVAPGDGQTPPVAPRPPPNAFEPVLVLARALFVAALALTLFWPTL